MAKSNAESILESGASLLRPLLEPHGFQLSEVSLTRGSGGTGATCAFTCGQKRLELHYRYSLGLVTYHVGEASLLHEDYMRLKGVGKQASYPDFPKQPIESFEHLALDLASFCKDFVQGSGKEIAELSGLARNHPKNRLP